MHKKQMQFFFSFFVSWNFTFLPNECPGLCQHRTGLLFAKKMLLSSFFQVLPILPIKVTRPRDGPKSQKMSLVIKKASVNSTSAL